MEHLYKAYDMLDRELGEMVGGDGRIRTQDDVHLIKELSGGMKNIKTVIAMCEADDEYSMANGGNGGMNSARRGGRSRSNSRSSHGMYGGYGSRGHGFGRGYSRDDGMDKVMEKIEDIKQTIQQMEND